MYMTVLSWKIDDFSLRRPHMRMLFKALPGYRGTFPIHGIKANQKCVSSVEQILMVHGKAIEDWASPLQPLCAVNTAAGQKTLLQTLAPVPCYSWPPGRQLSGAAPGAGRPADLSPGHAASPAADSAPPAASHGECSPARFGHLQPTI